MENFIDVIGYEGLYQVGNLGSEKHEILKPKKEYTPFQRKKNEKKRINSRTNRIYQRKQN